MSTPRGTDHAESTHARDAVQWASVAASPNDGDALEHRRRQLDAITLLDMPRNRDELLIDAVQGRRVLDVGCVDHSPDSASSPLFLHRAIAQAADECLGVDLHEEGIENLRDHGYNVLRADLTDPEGRREIARRGPFDVIVAGEIIEHLETPTALFELAASCLAPDGRLVITTPNPYAPHRVVSGRRMTAWENVDHLFYVFPSGLVELASRSGLELDAATTTGTRSLRYRTLLLFGWMKARLRRITRGRDADASPRAFDLPLIEILSLFRLSRRSRTWLGENAIYIVKRPSPQ
jgi:2-polyprenyl-3-methyl-5-hydroxy-6-metoxy-1,4-benzoquinol methylase